MKVDWIKVRVIAWRLVRGAFSAALAQSLIDVCGAAVAGLDAVTCFLSLRDRWTNPQEAIQLISVSLVAGFFLALGKGIRDQYGNRTQTSVVDKLPF